MISLFFLFNKKTKKKQKKTREDSECAVFCIVKLSELILIKMIIDPELSM